MAKNAALQFDRTEKSFYDNYLSGNKDNFKIWNGIKEILGWCIRF